MCTVTVVPTPGAVRLACNRDERRTRPVALPPQVRRFGRRWVVYPIDPVGGGTWVAVNDAGLAMTLLNINSGSRVSKKKTHTLSRGSIIPGLLHCDTLDATITAASALDAALYAHFRLILLDRHELAVLRSDGRDILFMRCVRLVRPHLFTSSGLGDHLVEGPRRRLFAEFFGRPDGDGVARQDTFHRHRWPDRPHLSVRMARADARTVSYTTVELGPDRATLTYHPDAPGEPAEPVVVELDLTAGAAR
jgi:hypothetical protein